MTDAPTTTATNAPASPDPAASPDAPAQWGELNEKDHALGNVLRAVADLNEDDTRDVLLAVSAQYGLDLWHNPPSSDNLIRVSDAVKLVRAAQGVAQ